MTDDKKSKKSKKYPRSLTAPVDEDTWNWFRNQADAQFRTPGAHLRWLILQYRDKVNYNQQLAEEFNQAVDRSLAEPPTVYTAPHDPSIKIMIENPSDDEFEGVT